MDRSVKARGKGAPKKKRTAAGTFMWSRWVLPAWRVGANMSTIRVQEVQGEEEGCTRCLRCAVVCILLYQSIDGVGKTGVYQIHIQVAYKSNAFMTVTVFNIAFSRLFPQSLVTSLSKMNSRRAPKVAIPPCGVCHCRNGCSF